MLIVHYAHLNLNNPTKFLGLIGSHLAKVGQTHIRYRLRGVLGNSLDTFSGEPQLCLMTKRQESYLITSF